MHLLNLFRNPIRVWARLHYELNFARRPISELPYLSGQPSLAESRQLLEQIFFQNILPFWHPHVIDLENGGYRLSRDIQGHWKSKTNKKLINQARTMWFYSYLASSPYGTDEHLKAAQHGYNFLRHCLWDDQYGGFYWEVDPSGKTAIKADKHLYGQAFGLYALSEYALASGDNSAQVLAHKLFGLLETYAHDSQFGGYREFFLENWCLPPETIKDYRNNTFPTIKTLDTHLHLLEAITPYYYLTKDSLVRERLTELIIIQSNAVLRKTVGACTDKHQPDWTPLRERSNERAVYGHDLENVWLLIEACNAAEIPNALLMDLYQTLFSHTFKYGFDKKNGGLYYSGYCGTPADQREKFSWVQAEGLVSALQMYSVTGNEAYFNCFSQTLSWITKHQIDWEHGDWHLTVDKNGKLSENLWQSPWTSPYHNGRAIIKCLELLSLVKQDN